LRALILVHHALRAWQEEERKVREEEEERACIPAAA
jgi:hypothetical protein